MKNHEIEYLESLLSEIKYDSNLLKVWTSEEKYIMGFMSGNGDEESPIGQMIKYDTIYQSLIDLDLKIKISCNVAIEFAYSGAVQKNFSIVSSSNVEEEVWAYYYIENALYRTASLWDMLAQLYCMYYKVKINPKWIQYKKIFQETSPHSEKFKDRAMVIEAYLNEEDNYEIEGRWQGNHSFVNECRNKLVHRNSPNVAVISDYDVNFKVLRQMLGCTRFELSNQVHLFCTDYVDFHSGSDAFRGHGSI